MKNLILSASLVLGIGFVSAQKITEAEVPAPVKTAFAKTYPAITKVQWDKEDGHYEAQFLLTRVQTTVAYDAGGTIVQTESGIALTELPKETTAYLAKNLAGKKVEFPTKITTAAGVISYEAVVSGFLYAFDSKGLFVKKSKDLLH